MNRSSPAQDEQHSFRRWFLALGLAAAILIAVIQNPSPANASATLPNGFAESTVSLFNASAFPTDMEIAPDGRIFVAQKYGQVRVIKNGSLLPAPFVSLTTDGANERGLVGITLDPAFASNGYVYVH